MDGVVNIKISFLYPGKDNDDIMRCLQNLFATPVGSAPLDRDFGLDNAFVDQVPPVAKNMLAVELVEKIEKYEPRVIVDDVIIDMTDAGKFNVEVRVQCRNT